MEFTEQQQSAIDARGCSLLVSAGAGSGKTRVLTERLIGRLLDKDEAGDITRFLVVTFTNAAAGELSDRIRKALAERLEADGGDKRLVKSIAMLSKANIFTIDAFCNDFVREHFEELGIPPRFRIANEAEGVELARTVIENVVEELLNAPEDDGHDGFLLLYSLLSGRDDAPFTSTIFNFYQKLQIVPSIAVFFDYAEGLYREVLEKPFYDTVYGKAVVSAFDETVKVHTAAVEKLLLLRGDSPEMLKKYACLDNDATDLAILASTPHLSFEDDLALLENNAPYRSRVSSARVGEEHAADAERLTEIRKTYAEDFKDLRKEVFGYSPELIKETARDMLDVLAALRALISTVDERCMAQKKRRGLLTFADIERLTFKLFCDENGERTATAKMLADAFDEIAIDEYQDVNYLQDAIFRMISRTDETGGECNRFLVGDPKQSIYRFRGARPEIFSAMRDAFLPLEDPLNASGRRKLAMQHNFRCAEPVIDFTNRVFSRVMPADYGDADSLIFAKKEVCPVKAPVKIILGASEEKVTADDRRAFQLAVIEREIRGCLDDPACVGEEGNRYTYSDIAVLTGKWNDAVLLEGYLRSHGIPVVCEKGEGLFDRKEVRLAVNLLRATDNPTRDLPLAACLRSPVGGFSDDDLVRLRLGFRDESLYTLLTGACAREDLSATLKEKVAHFLDLLGELRRLSRQTGASDFVRKMYASADLFAVCAAMKGTGSPDDTAELRRRNLMRVYDYARDFDKNAYRGLAEFLTYLESLAADNTIKSAASQTEGCVTIMTVHKSKGLEFPIVILGFLDSEGADRTPSLLFSEKYGVSLKMKDLPGVRSVMGDSGFISPDNYFRTCMMRADRALGIGESRRKLYVAVTRARDRLIVTAFPHKTADALKNALYFPASSQKTLLGMLLAPLADTVTFASAAETLGIFDAPGKETVSFVDISVEPAPIAETAPEPTAESAEEPPFFAPDEALVARIAAAVERNEAATAALTTVPPKMTVSLLKNGLLSYEDAPDATAMQRDLLETPAFVTAESAATGAERGTAMHTFLQFADFGLCERDGCEKEADRLYEKRFITKKQRAILRTETLDRFFKTPFYARMRDSARLFRERRFNLKVKAEEVLADAPPTGDFVLVQGVIDCFFENPDGSFTVLDFKTDHIREGEETLLVERYRRQLQFYCRAVAEMTEKPVSDAYLFSFALMKEIAVDVND